ncbi:hypothetical protein CHGG_02008 [Chaetomium globosum CBS 148.51]|uniref:Copper acquisition factor BIM1-like domain-containing protein n=1 Tax=Chaetomium globosum (strain ATCC 6205 / CBS 148.51 / DSM 1962 / NBRC 6347 / NRRL 1970) TaxID=306901 RepID=Q2HCP6_CHAGB|nr:uncharacterized protein CHGG_02008 [Chaetomium globosum CBS 148.51]EAQ93773.1 hypothetical protein CHGG_02008 [Chaetomium globosum CBS 148.51]
MVQSLFLLAAAAGVAQAHFGIEYPPMRYNTLGSQKNTTYSQWINPCAGVPGNLTTSPLTPWPLTGGSLKLDLHHPWTYIFVNLGLGPDVSNFNYTLTNPFWNSTGNGTLCVPRLTLPADLPVRDGSEASLQVVTVGEDGNALYNCADVVFRADAEVLEGGECESSDGVEVAPVVAGAGGAAGNAAVAGRGVDRAAVVSSVVALVGVFVFGMGL